jgi:signal transduction histidine kinase
MPDRRADPTSNDPLNPAQFPADTRDMSRLGWWRAYLGLGALLAAAYFLVPPAVAKLVVWPLIGVSGAAVVVAGARHYRPVRPLAWYLIAAGLLAFVTGDTLYNVRERILHATPTFPSPIDGLYLAVFPLVVAGLFLLIRTRTPGRDTASLLDATVIATGAAMLSWIFLIVPYVRTPDLTMPERIGSIAYPVADLLLLAMAVRLAVGPGGRPLAWWLIASGIGSLLAADVAFGLRQIAGTWEVGGPVDLLWIMFYVGVGAAALHPSMVALSAPATPGTRLPPWRLALLAGAALMAPAALVIQTVRDQPIDVVVIAGGSAVLFLLTLARIGGLATELTLQGERKRVMQRVLRATEEERTRLAADLHDGPVQKLTALRYGLARVSARVQRNDPGGATSLIDQLEEELADEIGGLRRFMAELRPPLLDQRGLHEAIRTQARTFEATNGVACTVEADLDGRLAPELETVLYRVVQESLTNAAKHARASQVTVGLAASDGLVRLRVRDDGAGFDPVAAGRLVQDGHFGLAGMRERVEMVGGSLRIVSSPGRGTTIAVDLDRHLAPTP